MRRFLQQLLVFSVLFWCFNSGVAMMLSPRLKLDVWDKYHWVLQKRTEQYDVVLVGSSRVMNSIDPALVDRHSRLRSINLGMGGSGAADQFLVVNQFLKSNSVGAVLLQVDWSSLASDGFKYPFSDYIWLSYDDDAVVRETIYKERGGFRYWLWRGMPFLRLMEFSSRYRFFLFETPPAESSFSETSGYVALHGYNTKPDMTFRVFRESEPNVTYLRRIIELCRDRDIPLVCFQSPYSSDEERRVDRGVTDRAVAEFARKEGVLFWDFSRDLYDRHELFFDSAHLNSDGVDVFSRMLGERIRAWQESVRPTSTPKLDAP
jgi:hypothetical protein